MEECTKGGQKGERGNKGSFHDTSTSSSPLSFSPPQTKLHNSLTGPVFLLHKELVWGQLLMYDEDYVYLLSLGNLKVVFTLGPVLQDYH